MGQTGLHHKNQNFGTCNLKTFMGDLTETQSFPANYWSDRYQEGETGWDLGQASPPLTGYIDQLPRKDLRILIPGCGNAYEAAYLLEHGFTNVTILDYAAEPLERVHQPHKDAVGERLHLVQDDFFRHEGEYDLILEQTFFCALKPWQRPDYVHKMHRLLAPEGKLAGVLFQIPLYEDHPPFGGSREEYLTYFLPLFLVLHMETATNSIEPRQGNELFIELEKADL